MQFNINKSMPMDTSVFSSHFIKHNSVLLLQGIVLCYKIRNLFMQHQGQVIDHCGVDNSGNY